MSANAPPAVTPKIAPAEATGSPLPARVKLHASTRPTATFPTTSRICETVVGFMLLMPCA